MSALPLSAVYDRLPIMTCNFSIQRNDETDEIGSGDFWQAELSKPRWAADVTLARGRHQELKEAAARIRMLDGARQSFLMCDPTSLYPYADPRGTIFGASTVSIREIGPDRVTARMQGFPAGYVLTIGDKLQVTYSNGQQHAYVEVDASAVASAAGNLDVAIFPRLSVLIAANDPVTIIRPACPVVVMPNSHNPGTARRAITEGAAFKVTQKVRV
ncbi:hypothetical protein C5748_03830 [Phyllobacterium phragmitis]|uniref:Uncharacterized protein n=1 Tax=Phyllobacterium phragmitis TaxID=2670329 RepID=A0A2S9IXT5_9HYPH|nr:hypothetical protein [Phyllobacterium phragmitis]PRD45335.1 hypothetical protein C5748_03830 [Phyllobacterium phragmitis]